MIHGNVELEKHTKKALEYKSKHQTTSMAKKEIFFTMLHMKHNSSYVSIQNNNQNNSKCHNPEEQGRETHESANGGDLPYHHYHIQNNEFLMKPTGFKYRAVYMSDHTVYMSMQSLNIPTPYFDPLTTQPTHGSFIL